MGAEQWPPYPQRSPGAVSAVVHLEFPPRIPSTRESRAQRREPVANAAERIRVRDFADAELELRTAASLREQALLRPFQREAFVVEQRLDSLDQLEVAMPVHPLASRILLGAQQLELGFPVPQDVRGHTREFLDLADPVIELVGQTEVCLLGGVRGHVARCELIRCLSPLLGLNVSTFRAVISML